MTDEQRLNARMRSKVHGLDCAVRGPTYKCDCGYDDDLLQLLASRDAEVARLSYALQASESLKRGYYDEAAKGWARAQELEEANARIARETWEEAAKKVRAMESVETNFAYRGGFAEACLRIAKELEKESHTVRANALAQSGAVDRLEECIALREANARLTRENAELTQNAKDANDLAQFGERRKP